MNDAAPRPFTLIAELTYRCPLHCPYCSNPIAYRDHDQELDTADWLRVLGEAEALGVVQVHFTGGEPLVRRDLEALVARARSLGLYTNLVTSGVPLSRERLSSLALAGLDHVQLSVQDADATRANHIAGRDAFDDKLRVAAWVKQCGLPLTLNCVLHRGNLDGIEAIVALAESLDADRLELANTQYHGFALPNRDALLPTQEQLDHAQRVAQLAKARLAGTMEVVFVLADYYSRWPRACMDGWARRFIHIVPDGTVLPCHAAMSLPNLQFENVRAQSLAWIWSTSPAMNAFRGEAWMPDPCKACDRRALDFGGCRCQAFALTGDAAATDPACSLSPGHGLVEAARAAPRAAPIQYLYRGRPG